MVTFDMPFITRRTQQRAEKEQTRVSRRDQRGGTDVRPVSGFEKVLYDGVGTSINGEGGVEGPVESGKDSVPVEET